MIEKNERIESIARILSRRFSIAQWMGLFSEQYTKSLEKEASDLLNEEVIDRARKIFEELKADGER